MKVIEPGHIYELNSLNGEKPEVLTFVNREEGTEHSGTQTQEVLRATIDIMECLIDRTNHCDNCLRWEGNDRIIKALSEAQRQMRLALLYHEQRALERKMDKGELVPDEVPTGDDGHFVMVRRRKFMPGVRGNKGDDNVVSADFKFGFGDTIFTPVEEAGLHGPECGCNADIIVDSIEQAVAAGERSRERCRKLYGDPK